VHCETVFLNEQSELKSILTRQTALPIGVDVCEPGGFCLLSYFFDLLVIKFLFIVTFKTIAKRK